MVLANLRARLTPVDVERLLRVLSSGDPARRAALARRLERDGIDPLLDDDALWQLVRTAPVGTWPPAVFFYVAVRWALRSIGIDDVRLTDYIGALLLDFGMRDRAYRIARYDDEVYRYLVDVVGDLGRAHGRRAFLLKAHLGNLGLWISGVFPDQVTARARRRGAPGLTYYETIGARGFRLASDDRLARELEVAELYRQVADAFPRIRVALNRLSDHMFFPRPSDPDRLLRHAADQVELDARAADES